ncbi:MAG TPA: diacylglycerol kinase [Chitinophagaceae bacterium]|nr:diacylglycerol kinase [Chitinophagaceae bacterium]
MHSTKRFSIYARLRSIRHALRGLAVALGSEHNLWIHTAATVLVVLLSFLLHVSREELLVIVVVTGMVWSAELFNSAVERIMDFVSPQHHEKVKMIKDVAAAGVLLAALTALVTGLLIFLPKLW